MIKIDNYSPEDLVKIKQKDVFQNSFEKTDKAINTLVAFDQTAIKTVKYNDEILAITGINYIHNGVVECWSITSDLVKKYPIAFHKAVLSLIKHVQRTLDIHRFQMLVKKDYEAGCKWARSLGFFEESILFKFGPDKSAYSMYVRLF